MNGKEGEENRKELEKIDELERFHFRNFNVMEE